MHNNDSSAKASLVIDLKRDLKKYLISYVGIWFAVWASVILIIVYYMLHKYNIYYLDIYYIIIPYAYLSKNKYCGIIATLVSYIPGLYLYLTAANIVDLKDVIYENVFLTLVSIYLLYVTSKRENGKNMVKIKDYAVDLIDKSALFMFLCISPDNTIIRTSENFKKYFGMNDESKPVMLDDLIENDDLNRFNEQKQKLVDGQIKNMQMDIKCNDTYKGRLLKLNAFYSDFVHSNKYIVIFIKDISDFVALKESEDKYRRLIEYLPEAVFIYSQDKLIYINKAAVKILGFRSQSELENYPACKLMKDKSGMKKLYKEVYVNGCASAVEEEFIKGDTGETVCLEVTALSFPYNGVPAVMILGRDVTERKKFNEMQKNMEDSKKILDDTLKYDRLRNDFMANITHELRTPINIILGSIQLIDMYGKDKLIDEKSLRYIDIIRQNGYRLLRLINNIIDMSKIDAGFYQLNINNENIVKIIEDITMSVLEYFESKDIKLIFDTNVEEKIIACDSDKIERIMLNLLSNAYKYTDKGGHVYVNINALDEFVNISVKDTGIGIPEDKLDTVFDRFVQVKNINKGEYSGSGIGLSLVKSLVELHDGSISLSSKVGEGSEFLIKLPSKVVAKDKADVLHKSEDYDNKIKMEFADVIRFDK